MEQPDAALCGGPLAGLRVIEMAGIGPAPFAAMVLADLGAEVVRVDRPGTGELPVDPRYDLLNRGKRSIVVDLKRPLGAKTVRDLAARADAFVEGFRPGVAERLGIGPDEILEVNPRIVYGRMTGWGQDGPLAHTAGHDLTYLAISGVLGAIGPAEGPPVPPLNLLGDYGGGGMLLATGLLAAVWRAARTGVGQVVDAAIVDGAALLATQVFGLLHSGGWRDARAANLLDGGAPHYRVYVTADNRLLAVAPLERRFYDQFLSVLGGLDDGAPDPYDITQWDRLHTLIAARLATRTRAEWLRLFEGTDACVAPVLSLGEARDHPHLAARGVFIDVDGVPQPVPAPRFSATPAATPSPPPMPGQDTREVLEEWGIADVDGLVADGAVSL
jgi:alpha-methylacyl-CoA racemase